MILKELDPFRGSEADVAARLQADRMAYFLRRHYRRNSEVDVLNDLRIPSGDALADLDHLLLHPFGFVLVAREPLSGAIRIDGEGRWQRWQKGVLVDAGSPITRAYVQLLMMKSTLDQRQQPRSDLDRLELDVLVVVPDEVPIQWPPTGVMVEVCRREEVADRVGRRLQHLRDMSTGPGPLSAPQRRAIGEFLCGLHRPQR
ncbi:MAG: NERD domain-containing protein [Rhodoferax sp.]|nr:NERD domain-containing protein [Rhodoferax sp.]